MSISSITKDSDKKPSQPKKAPRKNYITINKDFGMNIDKDFSPQ